MNDTLNIKIALDDSIVDISSSSTETLGDLKSKILAVLNQKGEVVIRMGFPPITLEGSKDDKKTLKDLKISNNELLRVAIKASTSTDNMNSSNYKQTSNDPIDYSKYSIYRKVIPADNSCLFNAINYAMNNIINEPQIMRELIAVEIISNPDLFCEAILEKNPEAYCKWIMQDDTWGGGIELSILSKTFQMKLGVVDINHITIENFGEVIS